MGSDKRPWFGTDLSQKGKRDTSTKELAQMLDGELAKYLEDVLLDYFCVLIGGIGGVGKGHRREIGAVY